MNIINGKKISGEVIDWYHLNFFCICHDCRKHDSYAKNGPHSCEVYPNINSIPREIWNTKNAECPYFEPMQQEIEETGEKPKSASQETILKKETSKKNHRMKKFSDLITKER